MEEDVTAECEVKGGPRNINVLRRRQVYIELSGGHVLDF